MTIKNLFIIHWNEEELYKVSEALLELGYNIGYEFSQEFNVKDKIEKLKPDIILIFLNEDPSRGEMAAKFIQKSILARTIPIIFVDGKSKHVKKIKFQYPNAFYTKSTELKKFLVNLKV